VKLFRSQQLRYGERTARGIDGGYTYDCSALALWERRKKRNSKRFMVSRDMVRDIASSRLPESSIPDRKDKKGKGMVTHSGVWARIKTRVTIPLTT
jgi:hypothetical protein